MGSFTIFDESWLSDSLGVKTDSYAEQSWTETDIQDEYDFMIGYHKLTKENACEQIELAREKHANFALRNLKRLPGSYGSMDSSKTWFCYWAMHTLRLLDREVSDETANNVMDFIECCQDKKGGFAGAPGQLPHLAPTYGACMALIEIGTERAYKIINRGTLFEFIKRMSVGDGSFHMHEGGEIDIRAVYCAISVASMCNLNLSSLFKGTAVWVRDCQTFEGGFGALPDVEAHGGYTYCAVATLGFLNRFDMINMTRLNSWLYSKQYRYEGAFCGRTNKLVDACYSFWQGASYPILEMFSKNENKPFLAPKLNHIGLQAYTLFISQDPFGGLKDKPKKSPDLYHTCYSLSGLSIAQHAGKPDEIIGKEKNLLVEIEPLYNMTKKPSTVVKSKGKKKQVSKHVLIIQHPANTKWYDNTYNDKATCEEDLLKGEELAAIESEAETIWQKDIDLYHHNKDSGMSSVAWMETVLSKGTFNDKVSAMQLNIRKSPVHSMNHLKSLVAICEKKKLRNLFSSVKLLKDMFMVDLLPTTRKLIPFSKRPLAKLVEGNEDYEKKLVMWKFESDLKDIYYKFLKALDGCSGVTVENVSTQSSNLLMDLLAERPERESEILSLIVNQLGNPNRQSASHIIALLKKLLQKHPDMKGIVVKEIEALLFRRNIPIRTQQYAAGFLTQIELSVMDKDLAKSILTIFFSLIKTLISQKNVECKIMELLIVGVYRILPFIKEKIEEMGTELESLYKLVSLSKYPIAMKTLRLIYSTSVVSGSVSDQFYASFYRFLLREPNQKLQKDLFYLLFTVVKGDSNFERQRAFIKRLLQMALTGMPDFVAEALFTIGKLAEINKNLVMRKKAADSNIAVAKDGTIIVKDEIEVEEDEIYYDYDVDADGKVVKIEAKVDHSSLNKGGWNMKCEATADKNQSKSYNGHGFNPLFANAHKACDLELFYLTSHYHPVVADFAVKLLEGKKLTFEGNFKEDLSIIRFLDRFAFQKGKNRAIARMDRQKKTIKNLAVNSEEYIKTEEQDIPLEERYLHRYACLKLGGATKKDDDDNDSINSDEFNDVLNKYTGQLDKFDMNDDVDDDEFADFDKEFIVKEKSGKKRKRSDEAEQDLSKVLEGLDSDGEEGDDSEEEVGFENQGSDSDDGADSDEEMDVDDSDDDNPFLGEAPLSKAPRSSKDLFADARQNVDVLDDIMEDLDNKKAKGPTRKISYKKRLGKKK
uniref:Protein farnesyltransferase subunit beta n=1 Tax=Rhabditophanes sp. KR3021 TaxID=114890 RepID=A0AC35TTF1_9BILA